jgi:hypothetical protein
MNKLDLKTPRPLATEKYDNIIEPDDFTCAIRIAKRLRREGVKAKVLPAQGRVPLCIIIELDEAEHLAGRLEYDSQAEIETRLDHPTI